MLKRTDIQKLFLIMQARYGHKWTSNHDDPQVITIAIDEWLRGLNCFPEAWIARGLEDWTGDWPPSLPEFQKACLPEAVDVGQNLAKKAIKIAAGDEYNFKRMPADQANSKYGKAYKQISEDLISDMIKKPEKYAELEQKTAMLEVVYEKLQ